MRQLGGWVIVRSPILSIRWQVNSLLLVFHLPLPIPKLISSLCSWWGTNWGWNLSGSFFSYFVFISNRKPLRAFPKPPLHFHFPPRLSLMINGMNNRHRLLLFPLQLSCLGVGHDRLLLIVIFDWCGGSYFYDPVTCVWFTSPIKSNQIGSVQLIFPVFDSISLKFLLFPSPPFST